MYPAGPAWPKLRVLRAMWALLAVLLAPGRLWAKEDIQECIWHVVLIKFEAVGEEGRSDRFFDLEPLETLDSVFSLLVDAPTDQNEKYLGFPYYLKINYSCGGEDYYFYLASNSQSPGNVYIDMASYEKIYDLKADYELPERIFLDKGTSYVFSVFLSVGGQSLEFTPERVLTSEELKSTVDLGVVLADPGCIEAVVRQKFLINRNSVLFRVTLSDKRSCFDQGLSGHHLLETSMLLKVAGAVGHCFQNTHQGPRIYVLKVVGGGPTLDTIREYSEEEIYRFNSPLDKTHSLIWTTKNTTTTKDSAFNIMSHQSLGIEWLCLENSPCYDTIPHTIFAPEFFFKVLVSNRGVDKSTYCDYQLIFLLHIHGLPLSAKRAFFILMVSSSVFIGLVTLYIIFCLLLPVMVKAWNSLRWKINNIIMSESYYTYTSPSRNCSGTSETRSTVSSRVGSSDSSKVAEANQRAPEQIWKKKPLVT